MRLGQSNFLEVETPAISNAFRKMIGSTSSAKMPQVLTVGSESLAAGFATGNNYTRTAECNRRFSFHERAPDVPFKLGLRIR